MAAYIGKIEAFDRTIEPWSSYVERLAQYFKANKVDDSLKVASLLSLIGGKTYNLLRTLTSPTKPAGDNQIAGRSFITKTVVNCRTI